MGKSLIINKISRVTNLGVVEEIEFREGVNLLLGSPHSGKTIWLKMLDYILGDKDSPDKAFGVETGEGISLADKYDSASAEISIDGEKYNLERRWNEYGMRTKVLINGEEILESEFSKWIFNKLDIPSLHYPKGNPYSKQSWPELSFRNLLRHIFRQEKYWNEIADRQPIKDQFATICLILGVAHKLFPDEFGELVDLNKKKMKYEVQRDEFKDMLDSFVRKMSPAYENITVATESSIKDKIGALKEELKEIEDERNKIIENGFRSVDNIKESDFNLFEELLDKKMELQDEYEQIKSDKETIEARKNNLTEISNQITGEIQKLERAQMASQSLSDLKITHCPACDQQLSNSSISDE